MTFCRLDYVTAPGLRPDARTVAWYVAHPLRDGADPAAFGHPGPSTARARKLSSRSTYQAGKPYSRAGPMIQSR